MTGAKLPTTSIFDCRPMLDTIEEFRARNEELKAAAMTIAAAVDARVGAVVVAGAVEESKSSLEGAVMMKKLNGVHGGIDDGESKRGGAR